MKHIVLIGFMGSGKSTMGKLVANRLACPFIDTDQYIEKKEGRRISEIFSDDGEEYFRSLETEVLEELLDTDERCVLSLGGGTPLRSENRELLKDSAYVIFLKITAKEAYERLKDHEERPLLQVENPKERIKELLEFRNPIYESAANYVLLQDGKSFDDVYFELAGIVREL